MDSSTLALVASVLGLLAVAAVGWGAVRSDRRLTLRSLVVPVIVLVVGSCAVAIAADVLARSSKTFAMIHLAYLLFAITVPAVAFAVVVAAVVRGASRPVWVVSVVLVLPAPIGWYGTHVAPYRLGVERAEVQLPAARAGTDPIRVGVLSDLQTTRITAYEERAVTKLLALRPDVILLPGDVFQGSEAEFREELPAFHRLLGRLEAPGGVYAVRGDTDKGDKLDLLVAGTDIQILDYEVTTVAIGDRSVRIGGNALLWANEPGVETRQELMSSSPQQVRILLSHRPDAALLLPPDSGVDLTVAGHTHGGQVSLPVLGPIYTFSFVSRSVARGGLHDVNGNELFVSSGVGMARLDAPQVRLGTRPAVGLIILR